MGTIFINWGTLNRLVGMQAFQASGRFKVLGDSWRFAYRAGGLRVVKEKMSPIGAIGGEEAGRLSRTEYLYDGQMPVCEQAFEGNTLRTTRVNFLGARGIEAVVMVMMRKLKKCFDRLMDVLMDALVEELVAVLIFGLVFAVVVILIYAWLRI